MENIYADIASRTGGNIYIGVVGPVRTGKSTLIKRIMETFVIPNIEDPYRRDRARDELPQSGSGKTIMTAEPKFVPEEAVEISPDGTANLRVRLIDSVGYMVDGAVGAEEDGVPRMVTTPWYDHEIPMTQAAELGTKKVMEDHCSIGLVVTTDGTVTDIPRQDYLAAEDRAIRDMQATGKPFLVVINSQSPGDGPAKAVRDRISQNYGIEPVIVNCLLLDETGVRELLLGLLHAFPVEELQIHLPRWMDALEPSHPVKSAICNALLKQAETATTLGQAAEALEPLGQLDSVQDFSIRSINLGTGSITCEFRFPESLFYEILSSKAGMEIENDAQLLSLLTELSAIKKEFDRISDALASVKATGYGIVMPAGSDITLEKPEVLRKGNAYGVRLKAAAPSIHMLRVDIDTEITPMVGDEQQSRELIAYLGSEEPEKLWESNIFGKSVYELIRDGLNTKLVRTPDEVRGKFRGTLNRIVNEGATGLICLIL